MTDRDFELRFHEELLLLALRDEKGTIHSKASMCNFAMAAGMLAELLLAERIAVSDDRRKFVDVVNSKPLGDPLLDECLAKIEQAKRRARLQTWVMRFAQIKRLRHRVAADLCRKGALREDEDKVLLIFTRKLYPERDARFERRIIERLRKAVFSDARTVDPRTAILVSLASSTSLLAIPFDKRELRSRKARIEQISQGEALGRAACEAVQAAHAAIMAACTAASTAATIAATS